VRIWGRCRAGQAIGVAVRVVVVLLLAINAGACGEAPSSSPGSPVREFGVMTKVDSGGHTVTFVEAQLFTGADAEREAAKDGTSVGGPLYVRKTDRERTVTVAPDARVLLLLNDQSGALLPSLVPTTDFFDTDPRSATDFYWFSITDGTAVAIEAIESP
jgi:hypothetical protein